MGDNTKSADVSISVESVDDQSSSIPPPKIATTASEPPLSKKSREDHDRGSLVTEEGVSGYTCAFMTLLSPSHRRYGRPLCPAQPSPHRQLLTSGLSPTQTQNFLYGSPKSGSNIILYTRTKPEAALMESTNNNELHFVFMHYDPEYDRLRSNRSKRGAHELHVYLSKKHDDLLANTLQPGSYKKTLSLVIVDGFAVEITDHQANVLRSVKEVRLVEKNQELPN
ncbi:hypothetical protein ACH5RR_041710 [Cinchona calisaya]|uniref:Inhibitor I9 domain-containing protein n=1 Tax=Cinchona calisaya TaxID=153742 RepID=A0ABD2XZR5_9GENT